MMSPTANAKADSVAAVLQQALPDIMAAYVFGSTAREDDHPDSDIDIAVLLPPGQRLTDPLTLAAKLREATGCPVDITDLRHAGNVLRMQVLREGRPLIDTYPDQVLAWEASAMSEYAQHRTAIHDTLQDFQNTGIGYHPLTRSRHSKSPHCNAVQCEHEFELSVKRVALHS